MAITLRPVTSADLPTIQSIAHRTWPDTFGSILSPQQIAYMLEMMYTPESLNNQQDKGHQFLLLNQDGIDIGYVGYQHNYLPATTKIHKLYVLPAHHGHGHGKRMILHVRQLAEAAGQQRLRLDVNFQNKAIGFYQHLGFVNIGRHDTDIGNGYLMEDYVFELEL